jgi:hypothetical protein
MPDGEVTIGELSRTIAAMDGRINAQFNAINRRFDNLEFVHRDTYTAQMGALIDRVHTLEESKTWLTRTLVAAFIVAFISPLLVGLVVAR